jgi:hypothetical protein
VVVVLSQPGAPLPNAKHRLTSVVRSGTPDRNPNAWVPQIRIRVVDH